MSKPELTLELIRDGNYNTDRPSHIIISDLLEVVIFLDDKINQHKDEPFINWDNDGSMSFGDNENYKNYLDE